MFRHVRRDITSVTQRAFFPSAVRMGMCGVSSKPSRATAPPSPHIYTSTLPSIMDVVNREVSLYGYVDACWQRADPNVPCVVQAETGQSFRFGEMPELTEHMARVLFHLGDLRKGDVVSLTMLNSVLYPVVSFGALKLGAKVSTVNPISDAQTIASLLMLNRTKLLLTISFFQKTMEEAVAIVHKETGRTIKILYPETFLSMRGPQPIPADYTPLVDATPNDTVVIPFSSGSTGPPKGVELTNRGLIANIAQVISVFKATPSDVSISILPFFHIFGFTCCLNAVMCAGATQVIMMKYSANTFLDIVDKHKVTFCLIAPPILVSLMKNKEKLKTRDLSSLRGLRSGSAPLSPEMEKECEEALGCSVGQGYGMTEMSPVVAVLPYVYEKRHYGSSGKLLADTEMRIVKIDDNQQSGADHSAGIDVTPGEDGEVWFRGPQIFKGYLDNPEDTHATLQDGWYRSGDIGHFDEATDDLIITDRLKELIKYKGFQVSPAALEGVLLQHPWVQDCLVIGVPDPRDVSFENPRALVVLKKNLPRKNRVRASDEIQHYIMRHCPPEKRLHGGVRIVVSLERNMAGKIMRRQIRQAEVAYLKGVADGTIQPGEPSPREELVAKLRLWRKYSRLAGKYIELLCRIQYDKWFRSGWSSSAPRQ